MHAITSPASSRLRFALHSSAFWSDPLPRLLSLAVRYGLDGVEVRCAADQAHGIEVTAPPREIDGRRRALLDHGVALACLGTPLRIGQDGPEEVDRYLRLAEQMGAERMRVFLAPPNADETPAQWRFRVGTAFREIMASPNTREGLVCVENDGPFGCCAALAAELPPGVGVLWDSGYSQRADETPSESLACFERISHVHVKDLRRVDAGWKAAQLFEGDTPLAGILDQLARLGYRGFVSVETRSPSPLQDLERLVETGWISGI